MDISKILTISGKPSLFQVIGQTNNGVVVESLLDGKRMPVYSSQQVSALEEISIYGKVDDIPLKDIFEKILKTENGKETSVPPKSSGADLTDYFSDLVPEYDQERVYTSDIKKVLSWYNILLKKGFLDKTEDVENKEETLETEKPEAKKKPKAKSTAAKKS